MYVCMYIYIYPSLAQVRAVLRRAAAVEALSPHPIAAAFIEHADAMGVDLDRSNVDGFRVLEGEGVLGALDSI